MLILFLFLSTDFTDFCYAALNLRFNFLTSDFTDLTDLTDVGYAFGWGRDDEGAVPSKKTLFLSLFVFKNCFNVFIYQNTQYICLCRL